MYILELILDNPYIKAVLNGACLKSFLQNGIGMAMRERSSIHHPINIVVPAWKC